jgi:hypothetical protein
LEKAMWAQQQHLSQQPPTTSAETPQWPVQKEMPLTISYSSSPASQSPSTPKLANATSAVPRAPTEPRPQIGLWGWGNERGTELLSDSDLLSGSELLIGSEQDG